VQIAERFDPDRLVQASYLDRGKPANEISRSARTPAASSSVA
jgi:hypothetical protein